MKKEVISKRNVDSAKKGSKEAERDRGEEVKYGRQQLEAGSAGAWS